VETAPVAAPYPEIIPYAAALQTQDFSDFSVSIFLCALSDIYQRIFRGNTGNLS
jgi:hypothetical protein